MPYRPREPMALETHPTQSSGGTAMKIQTQDTFIRSTIVFLPENEAKKVLTGIEIDLVNNGYRIIGQTFTCPVPTADIWEITVHSQKTTKLEIVI